MNCMGIQPPIQIEQERLVLRRLPMFNFHRYAIYYTDIEAITAVAVNGSQKSFLSITLHNGIEVKSRALPHAQCHRYRAELLEIMAPQLIKEETPLGLDTIPAACQTLIASRGQNYRKTADFLINQGLCHAASDIYFNYSEKGLSVRFKLDGLLIPVIDLDPIVGERLVNCIKVDAGMILYRRDTIQEGRISRSAGNGRQDMRVSVMPTDTGERIAIRLYDKLKESSGIDDLGYSAAIISELKRITALPNGFFVICGPSGSGKTTTLYALLRYLSDVRGELSHIITLEDPVEYRLKGITQVQIDPKGRLNFAETLKSSLRQDPGVIMIGEIRDAETANIAVRAALTGHLVLSSVHCGSAAEAVTRLLELDVKPFLLSSSLKGVLCQRIIRKVCHRCAQLTRFEPGDIKLPPGVSPPESSLVRAGCPICRQSGYHKRTVIAEFMPTTPRIHELIKTGCETHHIETTAVAQGMETLYTSGIRNVCDHVTDLDEIKRVIGF